MPTLNKQQLIELIDERYGDEDYFDLTLEVVAPEPDYTLMGCEFGSAKHMLRQPSFRKQHETLKLDATRAFKNPIY